jgi:copper chaperone
MSVQVEFKVGMTCEGCSGAVTRILKKVEAVEDIECDIEAKKVLVTCKEGKEAVEYMNAI